MRYDPYGATTITIGGTPQSSDPLGQPWGYTARHSDEETGLYYYRARAYDPARGRFLQRDPLVYWPGPNVYEYAASSPAERRDPLGLEDEGELTDEERELREIEELRLKLLEAGVATWVAEALIAKKLGIVSGAVRSTAQSYIDEVCLDMSAIMIQLKNGTLCCRLEVHLSNVSEDADWTLSYDFKYAGYARTHESSAKTRGPVHYAQTHVQSTRWKGGCHFKCGTLVTLRYTVRGRSGRTVEGEKQFKADVPCGPCERR